MTVGPDSPVSVDFAYHIGGKSPEEWKSWLDTWMGRLPWMTKAMQIRKEK
jgi:hypothetical protein